MNNTPSPEVTFEELRGLIGIMSDSSIYASPSDIIHALDQQIEVSPMHIVWMSRLVKNSKDETWYSNWSLGENVGFRTPQFSPKNPSLRQSSFQDRSNATRSLSVRSRESSPSHSPKLTSSAKSFSMLGSFLKRDSPKLFHFIAQRPIYLAYYVLTGGDMTMPVCKGSKRTLSDRYPSWRDILISDTSPMVVWMNWWEKYPVEGVLLGKIIVPTDKSNIVYSRRDRIIQIASYYGLQMKKDDLSEAILLSLISHVRRVRMVSPGISMHIRRKYKQYLNSFAEVSGISVEAWKQVTFEFPDFASSGTSYPDSTPWEITSRQTDGGRRCLSWSIYDD